MQANKFINTLDMTGDFYFTDINVSILPYVIMASTNSNWKALTLL